MPRNDFDDDEEVYGQSINAVEASRERHAAKQRSVESVLEDGRTTPTATALPNPPVPQPPHRISPMTFGILLAEQKIL